MKLNNLNKFISFNFILFHSISFYSIFLALQGSMHAYARVKKKIFIFGMGVIKHEKREGFIVK
jgi:hypothetical protein